MRHLTELAEPKNAAGSPDGDQLGDAEVGLFRLFGTAVAADFRSATGVQYLALALLVLMLMFEWGPGNEVLVVSTIASVAKSQPGLAGIPLTGLTGLGLVALLQSVAGSTALVGFAMFERTAKAGWIAVQRLRKGEPPTDWWKMSLSTRWALGFLVGASAVSLVQMVATGETGFRRHRNVILQSALLAGVSTGLLSAFVAALTYVARQFPATEPAAETIIGAASNPFFWVAVFVTVALLGALRSWLSGSGGNNPSSNVSGSTDDAVD